MQCPNQFVFFYDRTKEWKKNCYLQNVRSDYVQSEFSTTDISIWNQITYLYRRILFTNIPLSKNRDFLLNILGSFR